MTNDEIVAEIRAVREMNERKEREASGVLNIPDLINDFLVEIRERGHGIALAENREGMIAEVFKQKIRQVIELCAKAGEQKAIDIIGTRNMENDFDRSGELARRIIANIRELVK